MEQVAHDFDTALRFNEQDMKDCRFLLAHDVKPENNQASMEIMQTIAFALRFTKAALSGEYPRTVWSAGGDAQMQFHGKPVHHDLITGAVFPAMIQQLAKEVGHG